MAILPMISGPLSIIGSSLIINKILSERKRKLSLMYNRILLGFSICDIISSSAYSFSTLPSPSGTPDIWGARGNDTTCAVQGFVIQAGFSVFYYNSLLIFYYLLTIRYGMSEVTMKKYLEPWIHIFIIFMAIVPNILGVCLGMFNNNGNVCMAGDYPKDCSTNDEIECERGQKSYVFLWLTSGWLVVFLFFSLPINLIVLCFTLAKQDREVKRKHKFGTHVILPPVPNQDNDNRRVIVQRLRPCRSRRIKSSSRIKKARTQAIFYIVSSILCLCWPIFITAVPKPSGYFILRCLSQFFYPLQGFFNFCNYIWPRVVKLLEQKLAKTFFHALYLATFESDNNLRRIRLQNRFSQQHERTRVSIQHGRENLNSS